MEKADAIDENGDIFVKSEYLSNLILQSSRIFPDAEVNIQNLNSLQHIIGSEHFINLILKHLQFIEIIVN